MEPPQDDSTTRSTTTPENGNGSSSSMAPPPPSSSKPTSRSTSPSMSVGSQDSIVAAAEQQQVQPADGEFGLLLQSLEDEESAPLSPRVEQELCLTKRTLSGTLVHATEFESAYGRPLPPDEAAARMPYDGGASTGQQWYATLVPDESFLAASGKLRRGLNQRDFDAKTQTIKPRRPSLPITSSDFFSSLTKIDGPRGPRYIFYGILNGWPSLRCLELLALEGRRDTVTGSVASALPTARELWSGQLLWKPVWSAERDGSRGIEPQSSPVVEHQVCRASLRGAPWTSAGWSGTSPGFVWWFEAQRFQGPPRLTYGTNLLHTLDDNDGDHCTMVHMVSHRYAVVRETPRDRLTYHSVCFLEWEHGLYGTVMEAAYLNGIGGYKGKCNWYDDRDAPVTALYRALPPELICPWRTTSAEIRCFDVPSKTLSEFMQYVHQYTGATKRFVDPHCSFSHPARLTFRTKRHLAQYLLNYQRRDSSYGELSRNCQTFAADLCSFVAGKRNVPPFHPVSRIEYQNRTHLFLYDPHLYDKDGCGCSGEPQRVNAKKPTTRR